jgi:phosphoribosylpyrophosphate synthetase
MCWNGCEVENMAVIQTPTAEHLELEGRTLKRHPRNDSLRFPDGEVYVQLEEVAELDEATVVHAGAPEPNAGMVQLYGLLKLLKQEDKEYALKHADWLFGEVAAADEIEFR